MIRLQTRILLLLIGLLAAGCGGGPLTSQQEEGALGPLPAEPPTEQAIPEESDGNVSEQPGGEIDPPPESIDDIIVTNGDRIETVYVPYVEDVDIPETVIEGQPFEVTLHLSTALKPELLNGLTSEYPLPWAQFTGDNAIGLRVFLWENSSDQPPVYEHVEVIHQFAVRSEMDSFKVSSADSPEWGGLEVKLNLNSGYFAPHDHLTWKEYPITVLPVEEE